MSSKPFFSIVIPLYNKEIFVSKTLESVFQQTFQNYELLLIDDCSTDASLNIAKRFIDLRLTIIKHKLNKGLSATRNTGIANCKGDWICLLDADDVWDKTYLKEIYDLIHKYPSAKIIGSDYYEMYSDDVIILPKHTISKHLKKHSFLVKDIFAANMGQPLLCQSSIVFHKTLTKNGPVFNETITFGEDIDFYVRYFSKYKVAYLFEPLVYVKLDDPNQLTKSKLSLKKIPEFSSYNSYIDASNLEKYIDFKRYSFVLKYKKEKSFKLADKLEKTINKKNLNTKQRLLLCLPYDLLILIDRFKKFLLSKKIKVSTY